MKGVSRIEPTRHYEVVNAPARLSIVLASARGGATAGRGFGDHQRVL